MQWLVTALVNTRRELRYRSCRYDYSSSVRQLPVSRERPHARTELLKPGRQASACKTLAICLLARVQARMLHCVANDDDALDLEFTREAGLDERRHRLQPGDGS